jgi:type II secretory pathway pseudopilin PulG
MDEDGFTLVETVISLVLLGLVMTALLPALLATLKSGASARKQLQGKGLTQERLEQMRDLRFHVDRQNGPFLDLLDIYYTNATTGAAATTVNLGGTALVGQYVSSAAAANGAPAGPFYRVNISSLAGAPGYTEAIYTQFLAPDGSAIPAARFENVYDSQVAGRDASPTNLVGITVITSWTDAGRAKSLRTYTRLTESRAGLPLIQTQARAVGVDITSTAADGSTLELQGGLSSVDGAQSNGSSVAGYATGALATRTGYPAVSGLASSFNLPTQALASTGSSSAQSGPACSWYAFGGTQTNNAGGDVSQGLPKSPANVDSTTPPSTMSGYIRANGGGACGQLTYDNLVGGGVPRPSGDPLATVMGAAPYIQAVDVSGSGPSISGETYASSSLLTASPQKSISGAKAAVLQPLTVFPNFPGSSGRGLVSVKLNYAQIDCLSATTSGALGAASGKYQVELGWWGQAPGDAAALWHTSTYTYDSSVSSTVTVSGPAWNPTQTSIGNGLKMSDVIASPGATGITSTFATGNSTGVRGFADGILTLTTASTLSNEAGVGYSAIKLQLGLLTCVADDQR